MSKHTPGPWEAIKGRQEGVYQIRIGTFCISGLVGKENACLIAAAPELLKALKAAMPYPSHVEAPWVTDARKAIAKAEGENDVDR